MTISTDFATRLSRRKPWLSTLSISLVIAFLIAGFSSRSQAQSFQVLHTFEGRADGATPEAGLTMDRAGNLYGTTWGGGIIDNNCPQGCGTVYELAHAGSGWIARSLYEFTGGVDGRLPNGALVFGPDGALYGTTSYGGSPVCGSNGCGNVFRLARPPTVCHGVSCPWDERIVFAFPGGAGGYDPYGAVAFDAAGNIYGTTHLGGIKQDCSGTGCGAVYQLSHTSSGWTQTILYNFDVTNGAYPQAGVIIDSSGNLYSVTPQGGAHNYGTLFEVSPSGSGWSGTTIHDFTGYLDGGSPVANLTFDPAGNVYGTADGGTNYGGIAFEFTDSGSGWTENVIANFPYQNGEGGSFSPLTWGPNGTLYGITGNEVFLLTPGNGGWTYTDLHDFTGGPDGDMPSGVLVVDASGNVYGTTFSGGDPNCVVDQGAGCGVLYEITP